MATSTTAVAASRPGGIDPARALFRLLTSVRFALLLIAFLALSALAGVLLPQVPPEMRGNPAAVEAWVRFQEGKFGFATDAMYRLGLFTVFRSTWFVAGLSTLVVSICVCTVNRFAPVWRNVTRPTIRVPDDFFERGQPVVAVDGADFERLAAELRRRRYKVSLEAEGETRYIFADRFPWSQLATFVSHLALILFVAGGLVTLMVAKEEMVFAPEGSSTPVFATDDRDHLQVLVSDAIGRFDEKGFPLEFRTVMTVFKDGREVASGASTVSSPLRYGGFSFHQTAYFPDGAALRVRDVASGRSVYAETLPLTTLAATPRVVIRDGEGRVLLDETVVATDFVQGVAGALIAVPGRESRVWVGARGIEESGSWQLLVFETAGGAGASGVLGPGQALRLGDLAVEFAGMTAVPSEVVEGIPGAEGGAVVQLSDGPDGKVLAVSPVQGQALSLSAGEAVRLGGYEYVFEGPREFAGITVRRDPGSTFIWAGTALLLAGLALTFYVPRRRLWGKLEAGHAVFRGLGGRFSAIERELKEAAARTA